MGQLDNSKVASNSQACTSKMSYGMHRFDVGPILERRERLFYPSLTHRPTPLSAH